MPKLGHPCRRRPRSQQSRVRPACHQPIGQPVSGQWVTARTARQHRGAPGEDVGGRGTVGVPGRPRRGRGSWGREGLRPQPARGLPTHRAPWRGQERGPSRGCSPRRRTWPLGGRSAGGAPGWKGPHALSVMKVHAPSMAGHLPVFPAFSCPLGWCRRPGCQQTPESPPPAPASGRRGGVGGARGPWGVWLVLRPLMPPQPGPPLRGQGVLGGGAAAGPSGEGGRS